MGGEFAKEFAGEYFDEAFLEHYAGDMLQHWPEDVSVPPWAKEEDDDIYDSEDFVNVYVEHGNSHTKRWLNNLALRDNNATYFDDEDGGADITPRRIQDPEAVLQARSNPLPKKKPGDLIVRKDLEERFAFLIPIITAILGTIARVGVAVARAGAAIMRVAKDTVKVGKGRVSKNSYQKQADGFGKIAKEADKFWKSCLRRERPPT